MTSSKEENCGNCRFWMPTGNDSGYCRRGPPTVILVGMGKHPITQQNVPITNSFFPPTAKTVWCGAWQGGKRVEVPLPIDIQERIMASIEPKGQA